MAAYGVEKCVGAGSKMRAAPRNTRLRLVGGIGSPERAVAPDDFLRGKPCAVFDGAAA